VMPCLNEAHGGTTSEAIAQAEAAIDLWI
jgi:predicted RNase H-like HicB family nuclease